MKISMPEPHVGLALRDTSRLDCGARGSQVAFALIGLSAFVIYWASSFALVARGGTQHFYVDTWLYAELAAPDLFERLQPDSQLARIFRFHPVTVILAAGWMKLVAPLEVWFTPAQLLKALFAAVGALGVWAALQAFARVVPRGQALLWGIIYGSALCLWYFSSIEESKIVTATLTALYIATYLRLRERWTRGGAVLLSGILLAACLNEIVAAFLVALPAVDAVVRERWQVRKRWWIAAHALVPVFALVLLESMTHVWTATSGSHPEGANHFSMFLFYASQTRFSFEAIYYFLANWLFVSIAAPERYAHHWANPAIHFGGIFMPGLAGYLSSPLPGALAAVVGAILTASIVIRRSASTVAHAGALVLGLLAFAFVRAAFFFVFNAKENMLFTPSATLAHLLLMAIAFEYSRLADEEKLALLTLFAVLLFVNNGLFIIG